MPHSRTVRMKLEDAGQKPTCRGLAGELRAVHELLDPEHRLIAVVLSVTLMK